MGRMKNMQPTQPEYSVIRTYLECLVDVPWNTATADNLDVKNARIQRARLIPS